MILYTDYFKPIPMNGAIHNVCVWVAQTQKTTNIPDVSSNTDFDFPEHVEQTD